MFDFCGGQLVRVCRHFSLIMIFQIKEQPKNGKSIKLWIAILLFMIYQI